MHRRGELMQAHVPRDANGVSPYRMGVVEDIAGLDDAHVEVVNHNAPGRQYAIAGTAEALERLGRRARILPGIDVPFHSSVLSGAVDAFRAHLEATPIDTANLHRWVPNLTGLRFDPRRDDVIDLLARQLASPVG